MKPGEPFSAIVQSESMSYSSIVDRQRENADGSWFGHAVVPVTGFTTSYRRLTADTSMYFVWGSKSYCVYTPLPLLQPGA